MADHLSKEKRSWNMQKINAKNTKPELLVRKYLTKNGFRYRLHNKFIPGKPDLSNKSKKIAIFVNGCFWHRHGCKKTSSPKTNTAFWEKKFADNVKRDKMNYQKLKNMGWMHIIVWECQISENYLEILFKNLTPH